MKVKPKLFLAAIVALPFLFTETRAQVPKNELTLWYNTPAKNWLEALPLGNGLIGTMVFGGTSSETLVLNEGTLWAEEPGGRYMPDITKDSSYVFNLIRTGQHAEADLYVTKHWLGRSVPCYESLGNIRMFFDSTGVVSDYKRQLDLTEAVARVHYNRNGVSFDREVFTSYPDHAVIMHFYADKEGAIDFKLGLESQHPTAKLKASGPNEITFTGQLPGIALRRTLEYVEQNNEQWKYPEIWNKDGTRKPFAKQIMYGSEVDGKGMYFQVRVRVLNSNGKVSTSDDGLVIEDAQDVTLAVAIASSYNGFDKSPSREGIDPATRTSSVISKLIGKTYQQLLSTHLADYKEIFGRVSLQLGEPNENSNLPTNERLLKNVDNPDPTLTALYYQFGRYLVIADSRPGSQPANLQGIWNVDRIPPWGSEYTMNVNMNMNYWGVEAANLGDCHEPLIQFMREAAITGSKVAKEMYHSPGWVMHHNTSIWRDAQPVDWFSYVSFWPMGGGWLCEHLWEHYQFNPDLAYLRNTAYPIIKGSAEFYDHWLVDDGKGHLLTPVSDSPENMFYYNDKNGKQIMGGLTMGSTMDMAIIREVFTNAIKAAKLLNVDVAWCQKLEARLAKLLPYQIGSRGQILEYYKEYKEVPPRHNTSPYYPLFPSGQITPRQTPELAAAVQKLMEERGARKGGGFPGAWLATDWARLGRGDMSISFINSLVSRNHPNFFNGGGNVFQIDANMGGYAAIGEMLLQSHTGEIELLPALPKDWVSGSVKGLRARGGFEVAMTWKNGVFTTGSIRSITGTTATVRHGEKTKVINLKKGETIHLNSELMLIKNT